MCANGLDNTQQQVAGGRAYCAVWCTPPAGLWGRREAEQEQGSLGEATRSEEKHLHTVREGATSQDTGAAPTLRTKLSSPKMVANTTAILLAPAVRVRFYVSGRD